MDNPKSIAIEVSYALTDQHILMALQVSALCTVRQAIELSGILKQHPEIDLEKHKVGIFSKQVSLEQLLVEGDRIEIYRPLLIDPKQARRAKALQQHNS